MRSSRETHQTWGQARDLFLDIVDLPDALRTERLAELENRDPELHGRVVALIAHDRPLPVPQPPARRFGPYEPVRLLGSGGMGEVWLARRADGVFEREVAIKVMRAGIAGEELLRRFERERQTLAALDHEYIARLFDAGTTDNGQPYLVLEYVEGVSLDEYVRQRKPALADRIDLFLGILAAVEVAHARGVIHRDLKPGNILVRADGRPRLLDFGIARIRDLDSNSGTAAPLTRAGHRLFTPGYGSPEQIRGEDVGEATDIFSLGVILYELLTDLPVWPRGLDEPALEREVLSATPPLPSRRAIDTKRRALEGDLDTIVEKCLRKDPRERYASVRDLRFDLEQHRRGEPIRARCTTVFARAIKRVKRHPAIAFAVGVALLAILVAWKIGRDDAARREELLGSTRARVASAIDLRERGKADDSARELEAVLAALEQLPDDRSLRARVLAQLAITSNHRSRFDDTLRHVAAAEPLFDLADPTSRTLRASALNARSYALFRKGARQEARAAAEEALAFCRQHLPPGDPRTIDALSEIADQNRTGVPTEQDYRNIDAVVEEARSRGNPRDSTLGSALNLAAIVRADGWRFDEAAELYSQAIEVLKWQHGEGHEAIALLRSNRGDALFRAGRLAESRAEHERALETRRALGNRGMIAISLEYLARVAIDERDFARAEALLSEERDLALAELGPAHSLSRRARLWLAILALERGDFVGGEQGIEAELAAHGTASAVPLEHEAQARFRLGRATIAAGELEAGRSEIRKALPILERVLGPEHRDTQAARAALGS